VQSICDQIESGKLSGRDRLPAEDRLAAQYRVSVGTVQKALAKLAQRGLIEREHGRGTFVADAARVSSELRYLRFQTRAGGELPLYVRSHKVKTTRAAGPWSDFLGAADSFIRIQRVIDVGGEFDILSEFVLRADEFKGRGRFNAKSIEHASLRE